MIDLGDVVERACRSLTPGGTATPLPAAPLPPTDLVAVLPFFGDGVRGVLGLVASIDALTATHPRTLAGEPVTERHLHDWVCESANQLLGRLEAHLQPFGLRLGMGTPTALRGVTVSPRRSATPIRHYELDLAGGRRCAFWLDLEVDRLVLLSGPIPTRELRPGEVLLF